MKTIITVALSDFKLIFRDPSLRLFLLLPGMIFLVVGPFLEYLIEEYPGVNDFASYIIMAATVQASIMFGFIYSMVFIDEKETEINKVYAVIPSSKRNTINARLLIPTVIAIVVAFCIISFQNILTVSLESKLSISIIAGLMSPILALSVAGISKNKMEGLTWFKIINSLVTLPLLAFFVPKFRLFFSIFPTHWLFQGFDISVNGGQSSLYFITGILYALVLNYLLVIYFIKKQFD